MSIQNRVSEVRFIDLLVSPFVGRARGAYHGFSPSIFIRKQRRVSIILIMCIIKDKLQIRLLIFSAKYLVVILKCLIAGVTIGDK